MVAATAIAKIVAFPPLGEARFNEKDPDSSETIVSGTSRADAVCFNPFDGPCRADLGGES